MYIFFNLRKVEIKTCVFLKISNTPSNNSFECLFVTACKTTKTKSLPKKRKNSQVFERQ